MLVPAPVPPAGVSLFVASAAESDSQLAAPCVSDAPPAKVRGQGSGVNGQGTQSLLWCADSDLYLQVSVGQQGAALLVGQTVDVGHQAVVVISELLHFLVQTIPLVPNLLHALSELPELVVLELLLARPRLLEMDRRVRSVTPEGHDCGTVGRRDRSEDSWFDSRTEQIQVSLDKILTPP